MGFLLSNRDGCFVLLLMGIFVLGSHGRMEYRSLLYKKLVYLMEL
jgi:hypothetical protein